MERIVLTYIKTFMLPLDKEAEEFIDKVYNRFTSQNPIYVDNIPYKVLSLQDNTNTLGNVFDLIMILEKERDQPLAKITFEEKEEGKIKDEII